MRRRGGPLPPGPLPPAPSSAETQARPYQLGPSPCEATLTTQGAIALVAAEVLPSSPTVRLLTPGHMQRWADEAETTTRSQAKAIREAAHQHATLAARARVRATVAAESAQDAADSAMRALKIAQQKHVQKRNRNCCIPPPVSGQQPNPEAASLRAAT